MNRKGFTLVELLAAMVILAVLIFIGTMAVSSIFDNTKNNYYRSLENTLSIAGNEYFNDNRDDKPIDDYNFVDMETLVNHDYMEELKTFDGKSICNPKTGVYIYNDSETTGYEVCLVCGDYNSGGPFCTGTKLGTIKIAGNINTKNGKAYNPLLSYSSTKWVNAGSVWIHFSIEGKDIKVSKYKIFNASTNKSEAECKATSNKCSKEFLTTGSYYVEAYDASNNKVANRKYFNVKFDYTPPTFELKNVKQEFELTSDNVVFDYENEVINIKDDNGYKDVKYTLTRYTPKGPEYIVKDEDIKDKDLRINKSLESGKYDLYITVTDFAGNVSESKHKHITFYIKYKIDLEFYDKNDHKHLIGTMKVYTYGLYREEDVNGKVLKVLPQKVELSNNPQGVAWFKNANLLGTQVKSSSIVENAGYHVLYGKESKIVLDFDFKCRNLEYNTKMQNLVETNNTFGYTITNNYQKDAGTYYVFIVLDNDVTWEDGTRKELALKCSIKKHRISDLRTVTDVVEYSGTKVGERVNNYKIFYNYYGETVPIFAKLYEVNINDSCNLVDSNYYGHNNYGNNNSCSSSFNQQGSNNPFYLGFNPFYDRYNPNQSNNANDDCGYKIKHYISNERDGYFLNNYEIDDLCNTVKIKQAELTITPSRIIKDYGESSVFSFDLFNNYNATGLAAGERVEMSIKGSRFNAGMSTRYIDGYYYQKYNVYKTNPPNIAYHGSVCDIEDDRNLREYNDSQQKIIQNQYNETELNRLKQELERLKSQNQGFGGYNDYRIRELENRIRQMESNKNKEPIKVFNDNTETTRFYKITGEMNSVTINRVKGAQVGSCNVNLTDDGTTNITVNYKYVDDRFLKAYKYTSDKSKYCNLEVGKTAEEVEFTIYADCNHTFSDGSLSKKISCKVKKTYAEPGTCNSDAKNDGYTRIASGGKHITYSKETTTVGGNHTITMKADDCYTFSDGTKTKTITCNVKKEYLTVTLDPNGCGSLTSTTLSVKKGSTYGSIPTPTDDDHKFNKWVDSDGNTITSSTTVTKDDDHTLKAQCDRYYKIIYKDGSKVIDTTKLLKNESYEIMKTYTKNGYTFKGWTTKSDLTDDGYNWTGASGKWEIDKWTQAGNTYGISNYKLYLYAIMEKDPEQYVISYDGTGGDGTIESHVCIEKESCTIHGCEFTYKGWNCDSLSTSKNKDDGYGWTDWSGKWTYENGEYGISDNKLKLYALWSKKVYSVTYIDADTETTDSVTYGDSYTIKTAGLNNREGFIGWTTNADRTDDEFGWSNWSGTWSYDNGEYGINNDSLILYARYDEPVPSVSTPSSCGQCNIYYYYVTCVSVSGYHNSSGRNSRYTLAVNTGYKSLAAAKSAAANVDKSTCVDPDTRVGADWRYKASGKTQRGNNISLNGYYQDTCANAIQNCRNASSDLIDATCSIRCSG